MTSAATARRGLIAIAVIVGLAMVPQAHGESANGNPLAGSSPATAPANVTVPSAPVHVSAPSVSTSQAATVPASPVHVSASVGATPVTPPVHASASLRRSSTPRVSASAGATPVTPPIHASASLSSTPAPSAQVGVRPGSSSTVAVPGVHVTVPAPGAPVSITSSPTPGGSRSSGGTSGTVARGVAAALGEARPGSAPAAGAATAGIISALFGSGPGTGEAALGGTSASQATRVAQVALEQLVLQLSGCLSALPYEDRLALQLSSGVGVARALDPATVAAYMHISSSRLAALERGALHELVQAARTGCGAGTLPGDVLGPLTGLQEQFADIAIAQSGAEAASISARPARQARPEGVSSSTTDPLLGIDISPEAQVLLIALLAVGSTLLIGLLFSDRFELGTRYREWRFRRTHRPGA
jgi:hypothetical protein